jgi:hypothetical protein
MRGDIVNLNYKALNKLHSVLIVHSALKIPGCAMPRSLCVIQKNDVATIKSKAAEVIKNRIHAKYS